MDITEQLTHESRIANRESRIALAAAAEITRLRAEVEALRADAEMIRTEAWESIADERAHAAYLRGIEEGKRQATTPQDRSAPARREDMAAFAAELKADSAKAQAFFQSAGIIDERGELMPEYAAPQQAEPALNERVGLAYKNGYEEALNDCIRNGGEAWARSMFANGGEHIKPQQAEPVAWVRNLTDPQPHCVTGLQYRTAADADAGVQYIPVYLHPPADEVQRLRDALEQIEREANQPYIQRIAAAALKVGE